MSKLMNAIIMNLQQSTAAPLLSGRPLERVELPIINFSNPTKGYLPMSALKFKRPFPEIHQLHEKNLQMPLLEVKRSQAQIDAYKAPDENLSVLHRPRTHPRLLEEGLRLPNLGEDIPLDEKLNLPMPNKTPNEPTIRSDHATINSIVSSEEKHNRA